MANLEILKSIDIESTVREALEDYFTIYCRPLPKKPTVPSLEVSQVGGTDENTIDTFEIVLDSRADLPETASDLLRDAIGALKTIAREQTTPIRFVAVNTMGSWGNDPVRPDLAMCSARLRITAHQINKIIVGG